MSTIPLLGGITAVVVGASLTMLAVTELQFQARELKDQSELLAITLAELVPAGSAQTALDAALGEQASRLLANQAEITQLLVSRADGTTTAVRVCRKARAWQLPWFTDLLDLPDVCAEARARPV